MFQFSSIGVLNAIIDIGVLNLLLWIWPTTDNTSLFFFNSIAYFLAIANSYYWNARFTFYRFSDFGWKEKSLFLLQAIIAWLVNNFVFIAILHLFSEQAYLPIPAFLSQNIAKGLAMFLSFTSSFFMMKYGVFRSREQAESKRREKQHFFMR